MSIVRNLVNHEEIDRYEEGVQAFVGGQMDPDRFMAFRLQHGIYGQRQDGVHMIRIKLPGGALDAEQMVAIADILDQYAQHDVVHITTRQDIQVHYVPTKDTAAAMRRLGAAGLTTREACGNTVRNVTACPLTGMCPRQHTDVTTHMEAAVNRFLRHPLTQHLPRKFKMSFSACETDCAQGLMHDLGVVAVNKNGRFGFKILAGGGLGHKPHHAITVEEFVEENELLPCMEALISLHNRYSDRKRRAKARIKFLVDKFGPEGFVEKYREELARTRTAYEGQPYPQGQWAAGATTGEIPTAGAPRRVFPQKQAGLHVFPISVPIGDINSPQLRGLAALMQELGLAEIRATQDQKLMLINVPTAQIARVRSAVTALGLGEPVTGDNVVACPGTSTCRLGITSSKTIGLKLDGGVHDLRIRASGCHNGCAQPETGDIGIYGEGKRLHGKLIPHYQTYFGGDGRGGGALAIKGPTVPAARIESAVKLVQDTYAASRQNDESFFQWTHRQPAGYFNTLLAELCTVAESELASVTRDHGEADSFKVLQLGGGECAGAAQELVSSNFAEAAHERSYRNAFGLQRKYEEAAECAEHTLRLVGQSLLFLAGQKALTDLNEIAAAIRAHLPQSAALADQLEQFNAELKIQRDEADVDSFAKFSRAMDEWMVAAAETCQTIDRQLDLSASLPANIAAAKKNAAAVIDLTGYGCPLHYIKARNELRKFGAGDEVEFLFVSGDPSLQVRSSLKSDGHEIISFEEQGTATRIKVRKAADEVNASVG